jgi:hypothetical protein
MNKSEYPIMLKLGFDEFALIDACLHLSKNRFSSRDFIQQESTKEEKEILQRIENVLNILDDQVGPQVNDMPRDIQDCELNKMLAFIKYIASVETNLEKDKLDDMKNKFIEMIRNRK